MQIIIMGWQNEHVAFCSVDISWSKSVTDCLEGVGSMVHWCWYLYTILHGVTSQKVGGNLYELLSIIPLDEMRAYYSAVWENTIDSRKP